MNQIQRYFRKAGKAIMRFFVRVAHGSVLDIAILVCAVGLVGVGTTIAVVSSQKPQSAPVDVSSTVPITVPSSVSIAPVQQDDYDPNENALDLSEYDGTLLTETADGGEAYLKETIFIGDSNTYRLATYSLTSWQNNLSAVGMGIQHVTSTPSMYFKGMSNPVYMARAIAMMQPRRIVITYGTNNTNSSAETFKNQYRTALEAIKKEWPYADIIINAIPPVAVFRSNAASTQKAIDEFNKALAELAKEDGYQFLNSSEVLKDPTTGYARIDYMIGDGLHLNEDGAKALMSYVRTHTHIVADTRPALKDVPVHEPTPEELFNPQAASSSSSSSSETAGVTVNFVIRGEKDGGTLSGTLMQVVEPGKACQPVTATAKEGFTMKWGCDAGGLYEGQGISTNGNQSTATYTVPSNVTDKTLNVWVTFTKEHVHRFEGAWTSDNDKTHSRVCLADGCTDPKTKETVPHTPAPAAATEATTTCSECNAPIPNPGYKAPCTTHTWDPANGKCSVCGAECSHAWGVTNESVETCNICQMTKSHNHTWGEVGADGSQQCSGCHATQQVTTPPPTDHVHNFVDGMCSCGETDNP